jgi:polyisoprenoid-binding protein YceI
MVGKTGVTSAVYASETDDDQAKLLVSIPLKSIETKKENK